MHIVVLFCINIQSRVFTFVHTIFVNFLTVWKKRVGLYLHFSKLIPLVCKTLGFTSWNPCFHVLKPLVFTSESTYKKCLREEWGKFAGYQLLSSFWLKVTRTDEDGNTTRWDRGTLPIRNLYPKWGMLRFGRIRKVTNWILILWFIVSYWWAT